MKKLKHTQQGILNITAMVSCKMIWMSAILISIINMSCNPQAGSFETTTARLVDTIAGSCPNLTRNSEGNIVLSWIRKMNDSSNVFCYALSADGKTFGQPVVIPGTNNIHPHAENLPKVIFKPSGEIIAVWGAANPNASNAYSGMVYYVQSFDEGKHWTAPKQLVSDTASNDQRYFDVALLKNGEAGIIWLDNRTKTNQEGSALYFASTNGRNGFQKERMIAESCCECCRTDLFMDTENNIHILYRAILNDSIRDMVHSVSTDQGNSFSERKKISDDRWVIRGCPHSGPAMTANKEGVQFAWFTGGQPRGVFYTQSSDNGKSFSARDTVNVQARHPQISTLQNDALCIVWDEPVKKENKFLYRIGLEKRSANGKKLFDGYITADTTTATYPVITAADKNALVAYCLEKNGQSFIAYQTIIF
jgi:hypothetical protein